MSFPIETTSGNADEGLNEGLNEGLTSLYSVIYNTPGIQAKEIQNVLLNRSIKTIERQMKVLIDRGMVERRGSRKTGGYWIVER